MDDHEAYMVNVIAIFGMTSAHVFHNYVMSDHAYFGIMLLNAG